MEATSSLEDIINRLEDRAKYTLFLIGKGRQEGCFRIDNTYGSEIKQHHLIFACYDKAEIYHNIYESQTKLHKAMEEIILHKIEHAIKESYYNREELKKNGMKGVPEFHIFRITDEGIYLKGEVSGELLSRDLKELMRNSKTITILEKGNRADKLLQEIMQGTGRVRIHRSGIYFSELSSKDKTKYKIGDDYKTDPYESENNVIEHHKD